MRGNRWGTCNAGIFAPETTESSMCWCEGGQVRARDTGQCKQTGLAITPETPPGPLHLLGISARLTWAGCRSPMQRRCVPHMKLPLTLLLHLQLSAFAASAPRRGGINAFQAERGRVGAQHPERG